MKSLTCSFHLQELGREQDPEVQHDQMGRKGVDLQALVSPVFFNERMEEKPFFCTLYPAIQYRVSLGSGQIQWPELERPDPHKCMGVWH